MKTENIKRKTEWEYAVIMMLAFFSAVNYTIFVFPNHFAPAGLDGICTMIQDITHINMGYLSLLVNIPLLIAVFLFVDRRFAIRSGAYVMAFSISAVILEHIDLSEFVYYAENGAGLVLAPIAAGAIRGILYYFTLKNDGTSGGTDLAAALIQKKERHIDLLSLVFLINMSVSLLSYFVYGHRYEPVICSILYSFISVSVSKYLKSNQKKVRFEVVTSDYRLLCQKILCSCGTTSTVINAKGAYTENDNAIVVCVAEKKKAPDIEELLTAFPNTIFFKSEVLEYE